LPVRKTGKDDVCGGGKLTGTSRHLSAIGSERFGLRAIPVKHNERMARAD
jgi:hypothetical protein